MERENNEFMSDVMIALFNTDALFTYDFLVEELRISRNTISGMKQGKDLYLDKYLFVASYMMHIIHLNIRLDELEKSLRQVLSGDYDLAVGIVPHENHGKMIPENWTVVLRWEGVK